MYLGERYGLSRPAAFIIEWQYGYGGGFTMALADLISIADIYNLDKLALCFPDEVEGYVKFTTEPGWWTDVEERFNRILKEVRGI